MRGVPWVLSALGDFGCPPQLAGGSACPTKSYLSSRQYKSVTYPPQNHSAGEITFSVLAAYLLWGGLFRKLTRSPMSLASSTGQAMPSLSVLSTIFGPCFHKAAVKETAV